MWKYASILPILVLTACGSSEATIEERIEGVIGATIQCSWLSAYDESMKNNDPRGIIMNLRDYGLVKSGESEWDGAKYYIPTAGLEVHGFKVVKLTGWSRTPYAGNDIFWRPGTGETPPNFLELHLESDIEAVEEEFAKLRAPDIHGNPKTIRPIQIIAISSNLTSVRCELP